MCVPNGFGLLGNLIVEEADLFNDQPHLCDIVRFRRCLLIFDKPLIVRLISLIGFVEFALAAC